MQACQRIPGRLYYIHSPWLLAVFAIERWNPIQRSGAQQCQCLQRPSADC